MSTSIEDPKTDTDEDSFNQKIPPLDEDNDLESDRDDEKPSPKNSLVSPAGSGISKNSRAEDLDADLSATEAETTEKADASLKRSRKTYQWIRRTVNKELRNSKSENDEARKNFSLEICNFPTDWSLEKIKDVIVKDYGPVDYIHMAADDNMCFIGMVKLEFMSFSDCQKAWDNLHGKSVEDIKLFAEMKDLSEESDDERTYKRKRLNHGPWRPDIDVWDIDPRGLYGFQPEYLESLGVKPPIDRWVFVTNFRCDKSELKEVMELAGEVLICTVDTRGPKIGKVMYSHPLEAVQAVSMLNNQQFYGQALKVSIETCPVGTAFLPKGLFAIGPGLGADGKPLRDIVKHYERFVHCKRSFVNTSIFSDPEALFSSSGEKPVTNSAKNFSEFRNHSNKQNVYPFKQSHSTSNFRTQNPGTSNSNRFVLQTVVQNCPTSGPRNFSGPMSGGNMVHPSGPINFSGLNGPVSGPMGGMISPRTVAVPGPIIASGPMAGPRPVCGPGPMPMTSPMLGPGTMGGPNPSGPMPGMMTGPGSMAGPSGGMFNSGPQNSPHGMVTNCARPMGPVTPPVQRSANDHVAVELSNLPLSTTFTLLCEKMSECGQVMSVQLTSPGCAVVQFAQRAHAERCYQEYNKRCILGNTIEVKFI